MSLISWMQGVLGIRPKAAKKSKPSPCEHPKPTEPFKLTFRGVVLEWQDLEYCPACAVEFLGWATTMCTSCKKPIFPGEPVALAPIGSKYPYTCMGWDCCEAGILYCGVWGEGRLIPLHEVDPKQFPEGTASVAGHVMNSGETVIRNIP